MTGERVQGISLCVAGWWPEEGSVNGIFIREHVKAIARYRPVEVVYLTVHKSRFPWPRVRCTRQMDDGVPVHRLTIHTPVRRFGFPRTLAKVAFRRLFERIKARGPVAIVHIHVRTEVTEAALYAATRLRLPVVLTEHNSFYHLGIRALPPAEQTRTRNAISAWLAHKEILHLMPVSHDLEHVLAADYGVDPKRMTVVRNVAAEVFMPAEVPQGRAFHLLLAAVWRPPKDHDVLIRALAMLPGEAKGSLVVEWAGYGPDMARIKERCGTELPGMDIRFPGLLDKPTLARSMQQAHLFVLPTKADNFPCVILESLCCGTPVVSMAVNGVPEMIDASNGVLVPPSDPSALADALLACITGKVVFDRHHIASQALARYAPASIGQAIEEVYVRVINLHRP